MTTYDIWLQMIINQLDGLEITFFTIGIALVCCGTVWGIIYFVECKCINFESLFLTIPGIIISIAIFMLPGSCNTMKMVYPNSHSAIYSACNCTINGNSCVIGQKS